MVKYNTEPTGIMMPYEQAAINRELMPEGLEYPDQILFLSLRNLYGQHKMGLISRSHCILEKKYLLDEYRRHKFANEIGSDHMNMILRTEKARADYRKNRTLENADALIKAIDGVR